MAKDGIDASSANEAHEEQNRSKDREAKEL